MGFCPRLLPKNAFDLVETTRGSLAPIFGKRAPRLGERPKFAFRPGRKVWAARSKIAFSLKESAKPDVQRKRRLLAGPKPARRSSWIKLAGHGWCSAAKPGAVRLSFALCWQWERLFLARRLSEQR